MAAAEGNQYNKKWTDKAIDEFVNNVLDYVESNSDCVTLEKACLECGEYNQLLNYLSKKYNNDKDFESIKKARSIIKDRIISGAMVNKYNNTMSIFVLKNNHAMNDKQKVEHSGRVENVNITVAKEEDKDNVDQLENI